MLKRITARNHTHTRRQRTLVRKTVFPQVRLSHMIVWVLTYNVCLNYNKYKNVNEGSFPILG